MNRPQETTLELRGGAKMPAVGLGLWKIPKPQVAGLVEQAVSQGYRHLDCAADYGNEAEVGEGLERVLQAGRCRREELWITSKLWNTYHAAEHVRPAVEKSLQDLRLDYLDLYLIHFPIALRYVPFDERYPPEWIYDPEAPEPRMELASVPIAETWGAMEQLVRDGLVRNIGVCNFNTALLRDLIASATTAPAMLQVELHPYLTQEKLLRFCQQQGIAVTGFSPLGAGSYLPLGMASEDESVLSESVVGEIAAAHGKTAAQVVLRWGVQRGTAVVPKTARPERLAENLDLFDFELSDSEMQSLTNLNRNRRFNDPGVFCESAFGTFCPIYE
ncbi:aldo/keto reductase [Candidatus Laterigemmans baculatus]|uniref:aldo/keto reductase n=1 Tax=Candidatus Laterigemmans baculatus TaxID=2770505 RepID=UPI00193B1C9E|nr:aldo/keto reductase [Candidatus Laterigemmans baculatus]